MSEENLEGVETPATDDGGSVDSEPMVPKRHLDDIARQRKELKEKIKERDAKIAGYEAKKAEAEEAAIRAQGENEKIIAARDEELAGVRAELEQMKWGQRFSVTTNAVAAASGQDADVVKGLLLLEKQERGTDVAPEELSDDGVAEFVDMLRKRAPSLFQTQGVGGTPGAATGDGGTSETQQRAQRMGAHHVRK